MARFGLNITPVNQLDTYAIEFANDSIFDLRFEKSLENLWIVSILDSLGNLFLRRRVVSGVDIFGGKSGSLSSTGKPESVYIDDVDKIESDGQFIFDDGES